MGMTPPPGAHPHRLNNVQKATFFLSGGFPKDAGKGKEDGGDNVGCKGSVTSLAFATMIMFVKKKVVCKIMMMIMIMFV